MPTPATTRIWNVTDDPNTEVPAQPVVEFGKTIMPGRFITVDEALLATAHKLQDDVANKLVCVGKNPPVSYMTAKVVVNAKLPKGVGRAHGQVSAPAPAATPVSAPADPKPEAESTGLKSQQRKSGQRQ
jgi:hypothetical protein